MRRIDHIQSESMSVTFTGSPILLMLAADVCQHAGNIAGSGSVVGSAETDRLQVVE